jgi:Protein of unknown function (DUF3592)
MSYDWSGGNKTREEKEEENRRDIRKKLRIALIISIVAFLSGVYLDYLVYRSIALSSRLNARGVITYSSTHDTTCVFRKRSKVTVCHASYAFTVDGKTYTGTGTTIGNVSSAVRYDPTNPSWNEMVGEINENFIWYVFIGLFLTVAGIVLAVCLFIIGKDYRTPAPNNSFNASGD